MFAAVCYSSLLKSTTTTTTTTIQTVDSFSASPMTPPTSLRLSLQPPDDLKGRKRSASLLKVEEVGGRVEEVLDRSAYMNINANWVNAKGTAPLSPTSTRALTCTRCMADPRRACLDGQNHHRHHPRNDAADKLDSRQSTLPHGEHFVVARTLPAQGCAALLPYVPLGHRHPV